MRSPKTSLCSYLSTSGLAGANRATPHCRRQNVPSSQLTTKFVRDDDIEVNVRLPSVLLARTTALDKKQRTSICPLPVTG